MDKAEIIFAIIFIIWLTSVFTYDKFIILLLMPVLWVMMGYFIGRGVNEESTDKKPSPKN